MTSVSTCAFDLPDHLAAKADPALIAQDEEHFAAMTESLERSVADLSDRLAAARRSAGESSTEALERDQEIHRLTARLRLLRRFSLDLCLGRIVADDGESVYIGRLGLTDGAGNRLLVDWRSPAAEPFFGATHGNPMGLASRRRYRWTRGRVTDYWDEVFTPDGLEGHAALDDQSAFIASLGSSRSEQMRDVLSTIQVDQDAIIRAGSRGTLVVDGGPGTGKTVVALHRAAYLLYADPRLGEGRGGILFVGPSRPYLAYVADVLPSLGEEGVQTCTLRDLLPEGATAPEEPDPQVAWLKASAAMVERDRACGPPLRGAADRGPRGLDPVGRRLGQPARLGRGVRVPGARDPPQRGPGPGLGGAAHDPARQARRQRRPGGPGRPGGAGTPCARAARRAGRGVRKGLAADRPRRPRRRPVVGAGVPPDVCALAERGRGDRSCSVGTRGPGRRPTCRCSTPRGCGSATPSASRRNRRRAAALAAEQDERARVVDHLIATDGSDLKVMSMLRGDDLRAALVDQDAVPAPERDLLAGPFAHVVVDEAQELTEAEWQMLLQRCPSRSFTVVGDRAQARHGFAEPWKSRLERAGLDEVHQSSLTINYRTPEEVMAEAEPVIRAVIPDANVPTSVRSSGVPGRPRQRVRPRVGGGHLARRAPRGDRLRHRRSGLRVARTGPVAPARAVEGPRVRPGRPGRPGVVRRGRRRGGRPVRRDDPRDPAAGGVGRLTHNPLWYSTNVSRCSYPMRSLMAFMWVLTSALLVTTSRHSGNFSIRAR